MNVSFARAKPTFGPSFDLLRTFPRKLLLSYFLATLCFRGFLALWLTRHVASIQCWKFGNLCFMMRKNAGNVCDQFQDCLVHGAQMLKFLNNLSSWRTNGSLWILKRVQPNFRISTRGSCSQLNTEFQHVRATQPRCFLAWCMWFWFWSVLRLERLGA